jgi:LemA protein
MVTGRVDEAVPGRVGSAAMVWLIVILVVAAVIVLALIALYNRFVRYRNRVDNSWAQIEVQLKRRWDLIPNLVETVKGYAQHERGTFEAVTEARAAAQRAQGPAATAAAEGILGQALGRLFAVAEAYPELQADENFRQLQSELAETENRIAVSRQVYNDTVLTYNNAIQTFPGVVIAGPFGFARREFFETDETQREAPHVDFTPGAGPSAPSVPATVAPTAPPVDAPSDPPAS